MFSLPNRQKELQFQKVWYKVSQTLRFAAFPATEYYEVLLG
jgi:hypothetical protein